MIEEVQESKSEIIRRRVRMPGWVAAPGQIIVGIAQRMFWPNTSRIRQVWAHYGLDHSEPRSVTKICVSSINSEQCQNILRALSPKVVAVYGSRIIRRKTLRAADAHFINYHVGMNPKYRGQHPGYWALANGDADNAGVAIHLVDEGVDTGSVLYQTRVNFAPHDTIASYQHVQAAHALPLFARAIDGTASGRLNIRQVELPSQQFFPPTLWGYIVTGLTRGVW